MKPATCRICGVAEWAHSCTGDVVSKPANTDPAVNVNKQTEIARLKARIKELEDELRQRGDRKSYMREYMRARRQKAKAHG